MLILSRGRDSAQIFGPDPTIMHDATKPVPGAEMARERTESSRLVAVSLFAFDQSGAYFQIC